ncbi:MAG TPA: VapC toxin family PIN domain ribonuclease [Deltaproteobacteria bacterium]|nr:VapC toxin family PIN domain ribonuclease [Deltaproteobacteria bacterium]
MIFIDSNVPMYFIGSDHPNKRITQTTLEDLISRRESLVTNAKVLQEIIHRYTAIRRKEFIQPAFDLLHSFIEKIFDVTEADSEGAKDLVLRYERLSARDALHAAQMKRLKIKNIFSFDGGFDVIPGFQRLPSLL